MLWPSSSLCVWSELDWPSQGAWPVSESDNSLWGTWLGMNTLAPGYTEISQSFNVASALLDNAGGPQMQGPLRASYWKVCTVKLSTSLSQWPQLGICTSLIIITHLFILSHFRHLITMISPRYHLVILSPLCHLVSLSPLSCLASMSPLKSPATCRDMAPIVIKPCGSFCIPTKGKGACIIPLYFQCPVITLWDPGHVKLSLDLLLNWSLRVVCDH